MCKQNALRVMSELNKLVNMTAIPAETSKALTEAYIKNGDIEEVVTGIYACPFNSEKMTEIADAVDTLYSITG